MTVHDLEGPNTHVLAPRGDLDDVGSNSLLVDVELLQSREVQLVVVDLGQVDFIDSSGLGNLVVLRQQVETGGMEFLVRAPLPHVRDTIELAGLAGYLGVHASSSGAG